MARRFRHLPIKSRAQLAHLVGLLTFLAAYVGDADLIRAEGAPWVERLKRCVEAHLAERLTLARLARPAGLSVSFLTHHAVAAFGQTPQQYIRRAKMERAANELRAGAAVADVAASLGFCDAFHFSKTFKAFWGCPPSRYPDGAAPPKPSGATASAAAAPA